MAHIYHVYTLQQKNILTKKSEKRVNYFVVVNYRHWSAGSYDPSVFRFWHYFFFLKKNYFVVVNYMYGRYVPYNTSRFLLGHCFFLSKYFVVATYRQGRYVPYNTSTFSIWSLYHFLKKIGVTIITLYGTYRPTHILISSDDIKNKKWVFGVCYEVIVNVALSMCDK